MCFCENKHRFEYNEEHSTHIRSNVYARSVGDSQGNYTTLYPNDSYKDGTQQKQLHIGLALNH